MDFSFMGILTTLSFLGLWHGRMYMLSCCGQSSTDDCMIGLQNHVTMFLPEEKVLFFNPFSGPACTIL